MKSNTIHQLSNAILEAREPVFSLSTIVLPRPNVNALKGVITGVKYNQEDQDWEYLVSFGSSGGCWAKQTNVIPVDGQATYMYGKDAEYAVSANGVDGFNGGGEFWYEISHSKGFTTDSKIYPSLVEAFIAGRAHALRLAGEVEE
jgi:hypothetical protein